MWSICKLTGGPIKTDMSDVSMQTVEGMYPWVEDGGSWSPAHCSARHRVAVIIPYRNRLEHLRILLRNLHAFLQKQMLQYTIFLIEQVMTITTF